MRIKHVIGIAFTCMSFIFSSLSPKLHRESCRKKQARTENQAPLLDQSGIPLESGFNQRKRLTE